MDYDKQFEKYTQRDGLRGHWVWGRTLQTPSESEELSLSLFFFFLQFYMSFYLRFYIKKVFFALKKTPLAIVSCLI